jgi:hypothetical protein
MLRKDRCRIAEDEKLAFVEYPFLKRGKVLHAEEAGSFPDALVVDSGAGAGDAAGIELQEDGEASATDLAKPDLIERSVSRGKLRPGPLLFLEKPT